MFPFRQAVFFSDFALRDHPLACFFSNASDLPFILFGFGKAPPLVRPPGAGSSLLCRPNIPHFDLFFFFLSPATISFPSPFFVVFFEFIPLFGCCSSCGSGFFGWLLPLFFLGNCFLDSFFGFSLSTFGFFFSFV